MNAAFIVNKEHFYVKLKSLKIEPMLQLYCLILTVRNFWSSIDLSQILSIYFQNYQILEKKISILISNYSIWEGEKMHILITAGTELSIDHIWA